MHPYGRSQRLREACRVAPLITELITIESVDAGKIENKDCVVGDRSGAGVVRESGACLQGIVMHTSQVNCSVTPVLPRAEGNGSGVRKRVAFCLSTVVFIPWHEESGSR